MKHSAWNPTRRNRNIGTEKSGFSQNNKLVVPDRWVDKKERTSLYSDGHWIDRVKRGYHIYTTPEAVRNTQLFRTLPHEIGHAVDYLTNALTPSAEASTESESEYIRDAFDAKSSLDKEEYANRYAREFYQKNLDTGFLPFPRILKNEILEDMEVDPQWFSY